MLILFKKYELSLEGAWSANEWYFVSLIIIESKPIYNASTILTIYSPQATTIATATIYMHRFFMAHSMKPIDPIVSAIHSTLSIHTYSTCVVAAGFNVPIYRRQVARNYSQSQRCDKYDLQSGHGRPIKTRQGTTTTSYSYSTAIMYPQLNYGVVFRNTQRSKTTWLRTNNISCATSALICTQNCRTNISWIWPSSSMVRPHNIIFACCPLLALMLDL